MKQKTDARAYVSRFRLRTRTRKDGSASIYIDIYEGKVVRNGDRIGGRHQRKALGLYLQKAEGDAAERERIKQVNAAVWKQAEVILEEMKCKAVGQHDGLDWMGRHEGREMPGRHEGREMPGRHDATLVPNGFTKVGEENIPQDEVTQLLARVARLSEGDLERLAAAMQMGLCKGCRYRYLRLKHLEGGQMARWDSCRRESFCKKSFRRGNPFNHTLTKAQMAMVAEIINTEEILQEPVKMTAEVMESFFRGEPMVTMRVRNTRKLCALMSGLAVKSLIGTNWQAPIYSMELVAAAKKGGWLNRSDLTSATHAIWQCKPKSAMARWKDVINSKLADVAGNGTKWDKEKGV